MRSGARAQKGFDAAAKLDAGEAVGESSAGLLGLVPRVNPRYDREIKYRMLMTTQIENNLAKATVNLAERLGDSNDIMEFEQEDDSDDLFFKEESEEASPEPDGPGALTWTILMIDDDEQVHQSTVMALGDETILGRRLLFKHARSAHEALAMIDEGQNAPDLAFVDMVMETPDAGLRFATAAKADPNWRSTRILLRSGQPGFSNEMEQAREMGVEGFAQKASISRSVLIKALEELLSGRSYFVA